MSMSGNLAPDSTCSSYPRNCEILVALARDYAKHGENAGITDADSIVRAMAVGLVIEVWRNGPVEDMHASRRGPSDAAMFAESTALHDEALNALTASNLSFGLLDFEEHLLDRMRPWAGTTVVSRSIRSVSWCSSRGADHSRTVW
jgi:hypothetical protein